MKIVCSKSSSLVKKYPWLDGKVSNQVLKDETIFIVEDTKPFVDNQGMFHLNESDFNRVVPIVDHALQQSDYQSAFNIIKKKLTEVENA